MTGPFMLSRRHLLVGSLPGLLAASTKEPGIRVGCQANAWPLKEGDFGQLLQVIGTMKELGYTGFECNVRFVRGQFDHAADARRKLEETGVKFIGAHMSTQQATPDVFPKLIEGVAALGAEFIVMSSKGLAPDGKFSPDALRKKTAALESLGKACRQGGIRLAYHNHNPEFANGNAEINGLAEHTNPDLVSFLMDAGHGYLGGGDPAAFMSRHSRRIVGCHLKTYRRSNMKQVPLGQGDFGFKALAAAVRKTGWKGWLITEEGGGPSGGNPAAVEPDRMYIRQVFGV